VLKRDAQQLATDSQIDTLNKCIMREITDNIDFDPFPAVERLADDSVDAYCQQSLCSSSSSSSDVIAFVDCKSASCVDVGCELTSACASLNKSSSHADERLMSESHPAAVAAVSAVKLEHLDVNANELCGEPTLCTDTVINDDHMLLMPHSDVTVTSGNIRESCNMLTTVAADVQNLPPPARTHKRLLPVDGSDVACKRRRADDDCVDGRLLTTFNHSTNTCETTTNNLDSTLVSAAYDDVSTDDMYKSNYGAHLWRSICCCSCRSVCDVSSLTHCTDGHACCITCLQQQVKTLLSSPSKA